MSLANSPLFASLTDPTRGMLDSTLTRVRLKAGETLFAAGDPGDSLYVVEFGRLRAVLRDGRTGAEVLGEIGRGESVGEMALITGEPRSAGVHAVRDTELIKLSKASFENLIEREPRVMLEIARLIISRYQRLIRPEQTQPVAFALVPCSRDLPLADFTAGLLGALGEGRRTLAVDPEVVRSRGGIPTDESFPDQERSDLAAWLHDQELQHDFLVYVADSLPSSWTRLCVRQADVVLILGGSGSDTQLAPDLADLLASGDPATRARRELVRLYDSQREQPHGTAKWLARVQVSAHHHVDPRLPRDFERLARQLTGRAIGLVLGGGGARGFAHIGVIRALEEAGIPIDLVGGTSIGAIMGGQCASGWDSARMLAESRRALVDAGSLNDFTLPIMSLMQGKRFFGMLRQLYGDRSIEDLPIPFYCVSTNLTRSSCMVHRSGPVCKWVAASMAVPGLGPPIFDGQDVLVDGGVVNNLSLDVMRSLGRGPVFASSVSARVEMRLDREYPDLPSPWRVLMSWINPFGTPMLVPTIQSILMRTVSLQSGGPTDEADLLFELPQGGYKLLDWHAFDRIVETGYRMAVPIIEQWQSQKSGDPAAV